MKVDPNSVIYLLEKFHSFVRPLFISLFYVFWKKKIKSISESIFLLNGLDP
jgi:hypothetical protein